MKSKMLIHGLLFLHIDTCGNSPLRRSDDRTGKRRGDVARDDERLFEVAPNDPASFRGGCRAANLCRPARVLGADATGLERGTRGGVDRLRLPSRRSASGLD